MADQEGPGGFEPQSPPSEQSRWGAIRERLRLRTPEKAAEGLGMDLEKGIAFAIAPQKLREEAKLENASGRPNYYLENVANRADQLASDLFGPESDFHDALAEAAQKGNVTVEEFRQILQETVKRQAADERNPRRFLYDPTNLVEMQDGIITTETGEQRYVVMIKRFDFVVFGGVFSNMENILDRKTAKVIKGHKSIKNTQRMVSTLAQSGVIKRNPEMRANDEIRHFSNSLDYVLGEIPVYEITDEEEQGEGRLDLAHRVLDAIRGLEVLFSINSEEERKRLAQEIFTGDEEDLTADIIAVAKSGNSAYMGLLGTKLHSLAEEMDERNNAFPLDVEDLWDEILQLVPESDPRKGDLSRALGEIIKTVADDYEEDVEFGDGWEDEEDEEFDDDEY